MAPKRADDDATEGDIPDDHGSDHGSLASTVSDHSTIAAQDSMNDDDHHGVDIDNENGFMDGLLTARPTLMGPWVVMEIPRPFRKCCVCLRRLLLGFL